MFIFTLRDIEERYDRLMPDEIRQYLKSRGIPATLVDRQLVGWDGKRITIPIFGRSTADKKLRKQRLIARRSVTRLEQSRLGWRGTVSVASPCGAALQFMRTSLG